MENKAGKVYEWLNYASRDLASAKFLLDMRPIPLEIVCYHCQQAAEKVLKGFLLYNDIELPRTHVLKLLSKHCEDIDESFKEIDEYCGNLTIYGVQPRYPFELDITEADMKKAISEADSVVDFVRRKVVDDK